MSFHLGAQLPGLVGWVGEQLLAIALLYCIILLFCHILYHHIILYCHIIYYHITLIVWQMELLYHLVNYLN